MNTSQTHGSEKSDDFINMIRQSLRKDGALAALNSNPYRYIFVDGSASVGYMARKNGFIDIKLEPVPLRIGTPQEGLDKYGFTA
jgi:hypothetical protein